MLLNLIQSAELKRSNLERTYLTENIEIVNGFPPFKRQFDVLVTNNTRFVLEAKRKEDASFYTMSKSQQRKLLAKEFSFNLGKTKEYAKEVKDTELEAKVNFSATDINKLKEPEVYLFVSKIVEDVFTPELFLKAKFIEYKISEKTITDILAEAASFNKNVSTNTIGSKDTSIANQNIDAIIDDHHANYESMDNLIDEFATDFPDFVKGYKKNRKLEVEGARHEGYEGIVYKNGVIQPGAVTGDIGSDNGVVADEQGHFLVYAKPGIHHVQSKNANGDSQIQDIDVPYRQIIRVDFNLD